MTNKEYREHTGVSRSQLQTLLTKTPLHFKYELENPKEDTPALSFGRAAHKMVLEPSSFDEEFAVAPVCDRRTKEGKEVYAQFLADSEGKEVITADVYEQICAMSEAIRSDYWANEFLSDGVAETSVFWTDLETGEQCKVRPDYLTEVNGRKFIVDYKSTDSCQDGHFERSARKYGYKFQAGMYREGMFQDTYEDYGFVFVAQEKTAPYAVRVFICSDEYINEGYDQFRTAIGLYHYCKEHNNWFGYDGPGQVCSTLEEEGD